MKIAIFGLTISSSWGNGHATIWRGLLKSMSTRGHEITFFEKDVPYYAAHRDMTEPPGVRLRLYRRWDEVFEEAKGVLSKADAGMVTSYCPDAIEATDLLISSGAGVKAFYDLDTPVTLKNVRSGAGTGYIGPSGLRDFDIVLSYTGGRALRELKDLLGAKRVEPLYGGVDPAAHRPVEPVDPYRADLSYLGTYAEDRQAALNGLLIEPSKRLKGKKFIIGGSLYPDGFPWTKNIYYLSHVAPADHPAFYSSALFTLNVTRAAMAGMGWCPSGRLFEAAACGSPILTDRWAGIEDFFEPGREIIVADTTEDIIAAMSMDEGERAKVASLARRRALSEHSSKRRAAVFERILSG